MKILFLFAAIIAALGGFIGLIVIIKGFVDKSNKNIRLGTILVCIGIIVALSGAFCIGMRAVKLAKHHAWYRDQMRMKMMDCDMDMMRDCAMDDSTAVDSNGVKVVTKVIMDKQCIKKDCKGMCKKAMH
jgi:hypothetical protein